MFGLNPQQSFEFLEHAALIQICVGENEIVFHFDKEIVLAVESDLRIATSSLDRRFTSSVEAAREALELLGSEVSAVQAHTDGTLTIAFGQTKTLELYDSSPYHESYRVRWPEGSVVV